MVNKFVLSCEEKAFSPAQKRRFRRDVPGILSGCPGPMGVFEKLVYKIALMYRPMTITIMSENEESQRRIGSSNLKSDMSVWHVSFLFSIHRLCIWGISVGGLFWIRGKQKGGSLLLTIPPPDNFLQSTINYSGNI